MKMRRRRRRIFGRSSTRLASLLAILWVSSKSNCVEVISFTFHSQSTRTSFLSIAASGLCAKRNRRQQGKQDANDMNRWYESVDSDASPDDVFWEEMERQRLQNRLLANSEQPLLPLEYATTMSNSSPDSIIHTNAASVPFTSSPSSSYPSPTYNYQPRSKFSRFASYSSTSQPSPSSPSSFLSSYSSSSSSSMPSSTTAAALSTSGWSPPNALSTEATLNEYAPFAVDNNWLDDDLVQIMEQYDDTANRDNEKLVHLDKSDSENDNNGNNNSSDDTTWRLSDEPWDLWDRSMDTNDSTKATTSRQSSVNEFMLDVDELSSDEEMEEAQRQQETDFLLRLSTLSLTSPRLERARFSDKAKAFFQQDPDVIEGFDRCWVSAIDNVCYKNLKGNLRNYGIQFLDNFGDFFDGRIDDSFYTIEEVASFKARKVYEVTGLPCIASRTSWEIEPIPNFNTGNKPMGLSFVSSASSSTSPSLAVSPLVASGYRFNNVGMHVDHICDALRPLSEPSRVTEFRTCLCYYDGEIEVYDYGVAEVDLVFCNSLRTFVPVAAAINEMVKTLELTFGLVYQPWLKKRVGGDSNITGASSAASVKLRDRVLKEGRVLPNDIIDVSSFMDSMVDVELMDECAKELSNRFINYKPNKVLTVATTGLVIALPIAKYLQVPLVYARKERNVVMADTFKAGYSSKTVGKNRELLVSRDHLDEEDRVLVVDDFLSSGSSQEALLRIIGESGATAVGVGVLLEKVYESGRQSLSGFNVPIQSLCRVASLQNGVIQLVEEDGYDRMNKKEKQL